MTDRMRTDSPPNNGGMPDVVLDAIHLRESFTRLQEALKTSKRQLSSFNRDIGALSAEQGLAAEYRSIYFNMASLLTAVEEVLENSLKQICDLADDVPGHSYVSKTPWTWPATLVTEAKSTVEILNSAEKRVRNIVRSAQRALLNQADRELIDWTMPFDITFSVQLRPGPARQFYETSADGEPREIIVQYPISFRYNETDEFFEKDWNICSILTDCPLIGDHHGYLVHCLLDHNQLPWQALAYIRELNVCLRFSDWATAWTSQIDPNS